MTSGKPQNTYNKLRERKLYSLLNFSKQSYKNVDKVCGTLIIGMAPDQSDY